jgi:molybdopterin-guanine dinucleotide biosynthesis protein A
VRPVATGFVVAGGQSRRMGRDKALLSWEGATLLEHTVRRLQPVCAEVHILSGPEPRYLDLGLPVHTDGLTDAGPLAGVLAGLQTLGDPNALGLFLAVDLPFVTADLLDALARAAAGHDAVVPVTATGPEPLCAAYRSRCQVAITRRLAAGERRMTCFWPDVRVRRFDESSLRPFGDPARLFLNVNTSEDLRSAH